VDNDCDGLIDTADPNAVGCQPGCTDSDGDGFSVEGGECGAVDCNDADASVNPGAAENCTDGVDNDCDGLIDTADPNAVGCQPGCTDSDGDGFSVEGGACGPVDCNDADAGINPGAKENCKDGIDNNCNHKIDRKDLACKCKGDDDGDDGEDEDGKAVKGDDGEDDDECPARCTDLDGDGYYLEGHGCGPVDCDDSDPAVRPGAKEICTDGIDNNCNGRIDRNDEGECRDDGPGVPGGCTLVPYQGHEGNLAGQAVILLPFAYLAAAKRRIRKSGRRSRGE